MHLSYKLLGSCKLVEIVNEHLIIFLSPGTTARRSRRRRHLLKNPTSSDEKTPYPLQQPLRVRPAKYSQHRTAMPRMWEPLSDLRRTLNHGISMDIMGKSPTVIQANNHPCCHMLTQDRSNHSHRFGHGFPNLHLMNLRKKLPIFDQQCFICLDKKLHFAIEEWSTSCFQQPWDKGSILIYNLFHLLPTWQSTPFS